MVNSVCEKYEDLVCFVPVVTLTWEILIKHFMIVLEALEKIGFQVLLILSDGHKTNVKLYIELGQGNLKPRIPHPFRPDEPLFLLFDPVHLMKNFYNNFERHRF